MTAYYRFTTVRETENWMCYHNTKDAVSEFSKKYNCDLALAEEYLKVVRGKIGRASCRERV